MILCFSDSNPSESIQRNIPSALVVASLYIHSEDGNWVCPPVQQYKYAGPLRKRASRAKKLNDWLLEQKAAGLKITGFFSNDAMNTVAEFGLRSIEELPA